MERKLIAPIIGAMIFGLIISFMLQACRINKTIAAEKTTYIPLVITKPIALPLKKDTILKLHPKMTDAQMQSYLMPFYKANYDNFFAPDLKRMSNVINTQALSIQKLANMVQSMRVRSIKRTDSMNMVVFNRDRKYDILEYKYFKKQKEQQASAQLQLNDMKAIVNILVALWGVLILVIAGLSVFTWTIYKKFQKLYALYKSIAHV